MTIGELSRRTGVSPRALRYYEQQGLLEPDRRESGYRDYDESHLDAVERIRTLLAAGLPTATIAEVLPCMGRDGGQLIAECPELLDVLTSERERITGAIDELRSARALLERIIETSAREGAAVACAA